MKNKQNNIVMMIVIAIVFAGAGFYGGTLYQKSQVSNLAAGGAGGARFNRQGGMMQGGNQPVRGQIVSEDATSITVKMQDGSSKIINLSDKTTINKSTQGTKDDLKTGEQVTAFGTKNSDGSITAQIVSLGAGAFRGGIPSGTNKPQGQ